jgi:hypothetical protein
MFVPTTSDSPAFPSVHRMQQALSRLKRGVASHVEHESRLHKLFAVCQEKWLSQFEQLRTRIETLEARLAPWMTDRDEGPRLAVVPPQEDAA